MTDDVPPAPPPAAPPAVPRRAPGNRVSAGLVIALAVAALLLLGIVGLVAAALLGDDDEPTGAGLGPQVDVEAPATAPAADEPGANADATATVVSTSEGSPGAETTAVVPGSAEPGVATADADSPPSGDDFSDDPGDSVPTITTLPGLNELDPPEGSDLPEAGDGPVLLPVQVTTPVPPSTLPAVGVDELGPGSVSALEGWSEHDRSADHVAFTHDGDMVEVFTLHGAATADHALEQFYDDVQPDLEELVRSPVARLGAPSARFLSVAGSEYSATTARQQGTTTMSGTILAGVRPDGSAVVLTTSRSGESSPDELAADAELLAALLAQL